MRGKIDPSAGFLFSKGQNLYFDGGAALGILLLGIVTGGFFMSRGWWAISTGKPVWRQSKNIISHESAKVIKLSGWVCFLMGLSILLAGLTSVYGYGQVVLVFWAGAIILAAVLTILYYSQIESGL